MRKYNFIAVVHLFKKKLTATLESLQIFQRQASVEEGMAAAKKRGVGDIKDWRSY
jgi:hypothetical protein